MSEALNAKKHTEVINGWKELGLMTSFGKRKSGHVHEQLSLSCFCCLSILCWLVCLFVGASGVWVAVPVTTWALVSVLVAVLLARLVVAVVVVVVAAAGAAQVLGTL